MRRMLFGILGLGFATAISFAVVLAVGPQLARGSLGRAVRAHVGTTVDLSTFGPFDFTFTPQSSDQPPISQSQAVSTALSHSVGAADSSGNVLTGVSVSAQYGLFTDNKMTSEPAGSDQQTLLYKSIPVWIVTFTGPTVGGPPSLPIQIHGPVVPQTSTASNTEAVIVNATSGAAMLTFD